MSARPRLHADSGLQPERTSLSWTRTLVALMTISAILLRWSNHFPVQIFVVMAVLAVLALMIYVTQKRRYLRAGRGVAEELLEPNIGSVFLVTAAMVIVGFSGLFLVGHELLVS